MRQVTGLIIVLVVLAGCATTPDHKAELNTWLGRTSAELVSVWGPASKEYPQSTGGKILEYSHTEYLSYGGGTVTKVQTTYTQHGLSAMGANGGSMLAGSHATSADELSHTVDPKEMAWVCITQFTENTDGRIVEWAQQGNDCKAVPPKYGNTVSPTTLK